MTTNMVEQKLSELLRKYVADLPNPRDHSARQAVYAHFRQRFEQGVAQGRFEPSAVAFVESAIQQIEVDMQNADTTRDEARPTKPNAGQPANAAGGGRKSSLGIIAAAVVVLLGAGGYYAYDSGMFESDPAPGELATVRLDNLLSDAESGAEAEDLAPGPNGARFELVSDNGVDVVRVTGPVQLFAKRMVKVDPTKRYEVTARYRVLPRGDGASVSTTVYGGVATYDSAGTLQTSRPGTFRYAIANGETITSDAGWIERSAIVEGVGDERVNQFREGTASMRLVFLANFQSDPANVMEIGPLTWRQLLD